MTIIGKILTFLVFFLSLVFLGFAYNVNQLNKDPQSKATWYKVAQDLKKEREDLKNDLDAKEEKWVKKARDFDEKVKEVASEKENAAKKIAAAEDALTKAETARNEYKEKFENSQVLVAAATAELEKRRTEATGLYDSLKKRDQTINNLSANVTEANNKAVQKEVAAATYLNKLQTIERQYQELSREFEKIQEGVNTATSKGATETKIVDQRPPPEDVKGVVTSVGADGLVAISIGSDSGLMVGHTLHVFRTEPRPLYLGFIKIKSVNPHQAVGQIMNPQFKKLIQQNDTVASQIVH